VVALIDARLGEGIQKTHNRTQYREHHDGHFVPPYHLPVLEDSRVFSFYAAPRSVRAEGRRESHLPCWENADEFSVRTVR